MTYKKTYLEEDNPWSGILSAMAFAVRNTHHTTLQATPSHIVFGLAVILNTLFIADRGCIRILRKKIVDKNNQLENRKLLTLHKKKLEKILVRNKKSNKYENP